MNFEKLGNDLLETFTTYVPSVFGALVVLFIGWLIARGFRRLTERLLRSTDLDNRLLRGTSAGVSPEKFIAKLVYFIIMLIVMLVVLEMLGVHNVLDPVKEMLNKFVGYIPNVIGAGIIAFAGYMIATIVSEFTGFAGASLARFSNKMGFSSDINLAKLLKQLVFIIVFIPLLIAALDVLNMEAISGPLKDMLSSFINAIPKVIAAAIILGVFYLGGKYITSLGRELLANLGADNLSNRLNLQGIIGDVSISKLIANLAFFFIMFTGTITAVEKLELTQLSDILNNLFQTTGHIFFGLIIMAIGNYVSNIAYNALSKSEDNQFMASIARIATLGLFLAIALRQMGIANDIVNLAFGLTLGAVAVAIALSFGLGGREAAGKQMEHILSNFRKEKKGTVALNRV